MAKDSFPSQNDPAQAEPATSLSRRGLLKASGTLAAVAASTQMFPGMALAAGGPPEVKGAKLGFIALTDAAPLIVAKELGLFAKYGMPDVVVTKQASWGGTRDNLVLGSGGGGIDGAHLLTPMAYMLTQGSIGKATAMNILARLNINGQAISVDKEYLGAKADLNAGKMKAIIAAKKAAGKKITMAMTFPGGTHDLWIRYWLAAGGIDAVHILTPPHLHCAHALKALDAGLHVLVEKPLAMNLEEAQAMVHAAHDAGVFLRTAYRLHNDPATVRLTQLLREGAIGSARSCYASFTFQIGADNHRLKAAHWGGPLQDLGVYCVNAARHVFGTEPHEVMACAGNDASDARFGEVDADFSATLRFPGGRTAQFFCSFGIEALDLLVVQGTTGSIELRGAFVPFAARSLIVRRGTEEERFDFPAGDEFSSMVTYLSNCILNGQTPLVDATEGQAEMQVLLALEQAAKTRRPVTLDIQRAFTSLRPEMAQHFAPSERKLML